MRINPLCVAILIASGTLEVFADSQPRFDDWGQSDVKRYLQDHHVPNPGNLNTDQLRELAKRHWDETAVKADAAHGQVKRGAQVVFDNAQQTAYDAYSDSQLRKFLLDKGIISPASKREELIVLARQHGLEASRSADSAWARATDTAGDAAQAVADAAGDAAHAVGDNVSAGYYAALNAPVQAYDYVAGVLDDSRDYVYSSWSDSDLHSWLVSKGLVEPEAKKQRRELLDLIKTPYNEATTHAYEAWGDSALRNWLQKHGVVKAKTVNTRDELLDLMSRNYYSARDTTYEFWSDSAVRRWLESRGLVKPNDKTTAAESVPSFLPSFLTSCSLSTLAGPFTDDLFSASQSRARALIADNYWKLRDQAYSSYDDSYLKHYLDSRKVSYAPTAQRKDLLELVKEYWHDASSYVWDTYSDAELRAWAVKEKLVSAADGANLRRHELEQLAKDNWAKASDTVASSFDTDSMHKWLVRNGVVKSDAQKKKEEVRRRFLPCSASLRSRH